MSILKLQGDRVNIKEFLPEVKADVSGIDPDLALQHIMDSAVQLARESKLMRTTVCIKLEDCIGSYLIDVSPDIIYSLDKVNITGGGTSCGSLDVESIRKGVYLDVPRNTVYIQPAPTGGLAGATLELELVLIPDRTGDTIPSHLYTTWSDAVTHLALSRIYKIAGAEWFSLQASRENLSWYKESLFEIRRNMLTRNRSTNIRLRPGKGLRGRR